MLNINLSAGKQANPVKIEMLFVYAVLQQADEPEIVGFLYSATGKLQTMYLNYQSKNVSLNNNSSQTEINDFYHFP